MFLFIFFFTAPHFHLGGRRQHFHFHTVTIKCSRFSWSPLFLSLALALFLLTTSMQTLKFIRKTDSALLLCFFFKSPGCHANYCRNARVWCLKFKISPRPTRRGGRTYGPFSQNQNFLDAYMTKFSYPWCSRPRELCCYSVEREYRTALQRSSALKSGYLLTCGRVSKSLPSRSAISRSGLNYVPQASVSLKLLISQMKKKALNSLGKDVIE